MAGARPEELVRHPMLRQRWQHVAFIHWRYDPPIVQSLLPPGLVVDTFDGAAWVGLTPFVVQDSRPPLVPAIPGLSTFPETNLRTYVIGPDGRDGLWFFTLEADSWPTVLAARLLGVPYRRAAMAVTHEAGSCTYSCRRRGHDGTVGHRIVVRPGDGLEGDGSLASWLTGRWRAWIRRDGRFAAVAAEHEPWPLVDARLVMGHENLRAAAGLASSVETPVVHFASGVRVRLGWPEVAADGNVRRGAATAGSR